MEIIWTKTAIGQFEKAVRYTRKQFGDRVAEQFMQQVVEAVRPLKDHPQIGAHEPLLKDKPYEYRFRLVPKHKIIYRFSREKIYIVRFFHTDQNPKKLIF